MVAFSIRSPLFIFLSLTCDRDTLLIIISIFSTNAWHSRKLPHELLRQHVRSDRVVLLKAGDSTNCDIYPRSH